MWTYSKVYKFFEENSFAAATRADKYAIEIILSQVSWDLSMNIIRTLKKRKMQSFFKDNV